MSLTNGILDTNLLLLYLVSQTDPGLLYTYKRVSTFTQEDIPTLQYLLRQFQSLSTTSQVLTETSNLIQQAPASARIPLRTQMARHIKSCAELQIPAKEIVEHSSFFELGITDCALENASVTHTILSVDYRLVGKINASGGRAINFNHYRQTYLLDRE